MKFARCVLRSSAKSLIQHARLRRRPEASAPIFRGRLNPAGYNRALIRMDGQSVRPDRNDWGDGEPHALGFHF
jgi:hypothetical protein